jgi:Na+-transporting NADH:ubiquinone oxidoreductase subunit C
MNTNSNGYTFLFATIMVMVVGVLLSGLAISLKPRQDANVAMEKKQDILSTVGYAKAETSREQADELFGQVITEQLVLNSKGEKVDGIEAFNIDMAAQLKLSPEEKTYPLYVAQNDGKTYYIVPLRGKGLWGPIWGYVSLEEDLNTVFGASFDHKSETPGLGADINKPFFQDQFIGKKIMQGGEFKSIEVVKGSSQGEYEVDGISGGTITSKGVQAMLEDCISFYLPYFNQVKSNNGQMTMNTAAE